MIVRSATVEDIPAIVALERSCDSVAHWSQKQYELAVDDASADVLGGPEPGRLNRRIVFLAEDKGTAGEKKGSSSLVGFLVAHHIGAEWEIENIVVAASARRRGAATSMLNKLFQRIGEMNGVAIFLEVRESNLAARKLYEKAGFHETGRRREYYRHPGEDAVLYRRSYP